MGKITWFKLYRKMGWRLNYACPQPEETRTLQVIRHLSGYHAYFRLSRTLQINYYAIPNIITHTTHNHAYPRLANSCITAEIQDLYIFPLLTNEQYKGISWSEKDKNTSVLTFITQWSFPCCPLKALNDGIFYCVQQTLVHLRRQSIIY